jgi:O-antigen/teichoic acid export membrane protein
MDEAVRMGKASASGSFQLFIGKTVSTLIIAVGTIILGLLILEADYGLYTIALIPAATIALFSDWGVSSAMTKYCAQYRAANKRSELRQIIVSGLTFEIATGVVLTILSFLVANFIALAIFHKPEATFLITIAAPIIILGSLFGASQSIFVGFERMDLVSCIIICQGITQCVLPTLLVYTGYGAYGAVVGYVFSFLVVAVIAIALVYFAIFRKLGSNTTSNLNIRQTLRQLLNYGVPLAISAILGGALSQFYLFMMASFVDVAMIGNYKIATNFAVLLTLFTAPIVTVLFPAFSKLNPRNKQQLLKKVFTASVKYTALFLVPATMAMMVLSGPIVGTLYGDKWSYAPSFLALYIISNLYVLFGSLSGQSLFIALGETKMLMKLYLLQLAIGIPVAFLLIPQFGIPGVILVALTAGLPGWFIGLYWLWKRYGTKAEFRSSGKILLASSTAAIVTYLFQSVFVATAWIVLTTGVMLFLAIYLIVLPFVGAINQTDVNNLRALFSGLGIMSKLIEIPLALVEKSLRTRTERASNRQS